MSFGVFRWEFCLRNDYERHLRFFENLMILGTLRSLGSLRSLRTLGFLRTLKNSNFHFLKRWCVKTTLTHHLYSRLLVFSYSCLLDFLPSRLLDFLPSRLLVFFQNQYACSWTPLTARPLGSFMPRNASSHSRATAVEHATLASLGTLLAADSLGKCSAKMER